MPSRIPGFEAVASNESTYGLSGIGSREKAMEMRLADAAIRAEAIKRGAKLQEDGARLQAEARRYAGDRAADSAIFGSIIGAVGRIAAPIAGGLASGAFSGGGKLDQQKTKGYGDRAFSSEWDPSDTWKRAYTIQKGSTGSW